MSKTDDTSDDGERMTLSKANRNKINYQADRIDDLEEEVEHLREIVRMLQAERVEEGRFE